MERERRRDEKGEKIERGIHMEKVREMDRGVLRP